MDLDGNFQDKLYAGKVYFINSKNGEIVASGEGTFDTENLKLYTKYQYSLLEEVDSVRVVIETRHGYFSPVLPFVLGAAFGDSVERPFSMKECLNWPLYRKLKYITYNSNSVTIFIKARHNGMPWTRTEKADHSESSITLTDRASYKELEAIHYKTLNVGAFANFATSSDREQVDTEVIIKKRMHFVISRSDAKFTPIETRKLWSAFKSYWLLSHDNTTCEVTKITLGTDINIVLSDRKLAARTKSSEKYQPVISVDDDLSLDILGKMVHFYLNPDGKKDLSSTSKVGLALARTTGQRYGSDCKILDHRVADIIISLQGFSESYAQNEIRKENKARKFKTEEDVRRVIALVNNLNGLSSHVKDFYCKEAAEIIEAIDRPSMKRAIELTASKLNINLDPYSKSLKVMEKARRQVVHGQDYNSQDLVNLLTQGKISYERDDAGEIRSISFGVKPGALEEFYDLMHLFFTKYFENYKY